MFQKNLRISWISSLKKSKFFQLTSLMITLFASRRVVSFFEILCTIFSQLNSLYKRCISRNSFEQTWYNTSSLQLRCLCSLHLKKMKCCDRALIIENSTRSLSRIDVFFCWLMKLSIILQTSSDLSSLTSRTRSTNFAYKKKTNERWHFIQDLTYTSILWCSLISLMHRLSFRFIWIKLCLNFLTSSVSSIWMTFWYSAKLARKMFITYDKFLTNCRFWSSTSSSSNANSSRKSYSF